MNGQQAFFDALLDPGRPIPAGLTAWNGSDPTVRFGVYRNNVIASLIDALADTYPVTQQLVGEDFFRAMARLFLSDEPPRSRILAFYGESFPAFLEQFPPAASVPYLPDVARLEMMWVRAYHAAECAPLPLDTIAQAVADVDRLPEMQIGFHPSLGLLRSPYAVVSLWAAHQGLAEIATVDPYVAENALLIRPHLEVEVMRLTAGACDFVGHLMQGANLGPAVERASLADPEFDLAGILSLLMRTNAISSISTASGSPS
jgi:hypothetical protein